MLFYSIITFELLQDSPQPRFYNYGNIGLTVYSNRYR